MTWLPFDLHPEYPPEGLPRERLIARYGERMHEHVRAMFAARGLAYEPHPEVVPNTMQALRLSELAREHGVHRVFHDRVMEAYWAESRNIGDADVLCELAAAAGVPADEVEDVLAGDRYRDVVELSTRQAVSVGVTGVPGFVLDQRLLVLGAQPEDVFESAFEQLAAAS